MNRRKFLKICGTALAGAVFPLPGLKSTAEALPEAAGGSIDFGAYPVDWPTTWWDGAHMRIIDAGHEEGWVIVNNPEEFIFKITSVEDPDG